MYGSYFIIAALLTTFISASPVEPRTGSKTGTDLKNFISSLRILLRASQEQYGSVELFEATMDFSPSSGMKGVVPSEASNSPNAYTYYLGATTSVNGNYSSYYIHTSSLSKYNSNSTEFKSDAPDLGTSPIDLTKIAVTAADAASILRKQGCHAPLESLSLMNTTKLHNYPATYYYFFQNTSDPFHFAPIMYVRADLLSYAVIVQKQDSSIPGTQYTDCRGNIYKNLIW